MWVVCIRGKGRDGDIGGFRKPSVSLFPRWFVLAAMAIPSSRPHHLLRPLLRRFHSSPLAAAKAEPHEFSDPSAYLGSWAPASDPREARARLERLRKGYARDVGELRRQYAYDMQLLEAERQRKADARAEAARLANEQRKAAKAAAAQTRAAERRAFEQDFLQTLMKERAEKLESWRTKEKLKEQNKAKHRELLRRQSSVWVAEENLEERILEAITNTLPL